MGSDFASTGKNSKITRRDALKGIGGLVAVSTATATAASAAAPQAAANAAASGKQAQREPGALPTRPNILWITGEGVPMSVLSCYGSRLIETPNIDRIAKEGLRFTNSFTTNGLCAPSRATLLTGTYNHVNGMYGNPEIPGTTGTMVAHFDPAQETFPKILKRHGYQTGMVGKWHLPVNPALTGFDYFVYKNGAGGPYYEPSGYFGNPSLGSDEVQPQVHEGYETDVTTDLTIKGIQQFKEKNEQQPFLMMVQYFNAHRPFEPPHKYEHIYDNARIPEPGTFWDDYEHRSGAARDARMRIEDMPDFNPASYLTPRQRKQWNYQKFMEHFLATVRAQDDNIGRLLDFLDSSGLAENTIVVYTCDHGFFMGDHGWFDKRFMYEQPIHVPWMIRCPGMHGRGTVTDEWVINIDNAPTVLDLCGISVPAEMQGRSMAPLLRGETPADRQRALYYHYYEFGPPHWVAPHYGIRTERYKLIRYYDRNEWEFFDLERDPDEMESLFTENGMRVQPGYEDTVKQLVAQLKEVRDFYKDSTGLPVIMWPPGD